MSTSVESEIRSPHGELRSVNPATGEPVATFRAHTEPEIEGAIAAAHAAQAAWSATDFEERSRVVAAAADVLRSRASELAALITSEMGKPLSEAAAEIEKCARTFEYFAAEAQGFLTGRSVASSAESSYVRYEPLGTLLAIMPWNFPFFQVVRFCAPALMAGNAVLLKHAPSTSGCALAVEAVLADAGLPDGLFRALLVPQEEVGEVTGRIIEDPRVAAITLTGSEGAGAAVAATAGRALKRCVLELGGSDPFVVLADADVAYAAEMAARARCLNGGQSCISAKRFIVAQEVCDEFEQRLVEAVERLVVGDPLDAATAVGPLARRDLVDTLDAQVRDAVDRGARLLTGGTRLERQSGCFYAPTVLGGVRPDMRVFREETFGPVAAVVAARDEAHAVDLANDTTFGLGASVWTRDTERAVRLGRQLQSGSLFVNAIVASDPRLPFGGIKRSGYGRELSAEGIREFTNVRTYVVEPMP